MFGSEFMIISTVPPETFQHDATIPVELRQHQIDHTLRHHLFELQVSRAKC